MVRRVFLVAAAAAVFMAMAPPSAAFADIGSSFKKSGVGIVQPDRVLSLTAKSNGVLAGISSKFMTLKIDTDQDAAVMDWGATLIKKVVSQKTQGEDVLTNSAVAVLSVDGGHAIIDNGGSFQVTNTTTPRMAFSIRTTGLDESRSLPLIYPMYGQILNKTTGQV